MIEIGDHKREFKSLLQRFPIGDWITSGMVGPKVLYLWNGFSLQFKCVEHIHSCKEYLGLVKLSLKVENGN